MYFGKKGRENIVSREKEYRVKKLMIRVLFTFHDFLSQKVYYIGKRKTFPFSKQLGKGCSRDEGVVGEKNLETNKSRF